MAEENQVIYFTANDQIKKLGSPVVDLDQLNKNKVWNRLNILESRSWYHFLSVVYLDW